MFARVAGWNLDQPWDWLQSLNFLQLRKLQGFRSLVSCLQDFPTVSPPDTLGV